MSKPIPGTKVITPRFTRHFGFLCIDEFDDPTLMVIFSKIMLWHLDTRYVILYCFLINQYLNNSNLYFRGFSKEFDPCIEELVSATLSIYKNCRYHLLPTPSKCHYMFNLRDFSRVIQVNLVSTYKYHDYFVFLIYTYRIGCVVVGARSNRRFVSYEETVGSRMYESLQRSVNRRQ